MIQLLLPEHMQPQELRKQLLELDPGLKIGIGPEKESPEKVEFVVIWNQPHGTLRPYRNLKAICVYGHGVDSALQDPELPQEVPIFRLADQTMALWMSEYLLTAVLMHRRQMVMHIREPENIPWGRTVRLEGNRVGILGLGYLGQDAAKLFLKLGFEVWGWSRSPKTLADVCCFHGNEGLDEVLSNSDFLISLLPLTSETENLLDLKSMKKMKKGAYLINVGRGKVLVEEALIQMLDESHLSGACLDVFRQEPLDQNHIFRKHPKILVTPHNSSSTPAKSVAPQILENYKNLEQDRPLKNLVDLQRGY